MTGPDPHLVVEPVIDRAKRLGTFDKIDRHAQYDGPERAHPLALLAAVNAQGNHIRALQSEKERMQEKIANLRLRNSVIVALVTAIATAAAAHFLR